MHVLVLGAGVVGLATAYFLREDGHNVTVVDASDRAGALSSFANGGQLSYSYVAPLAGPGVLGKVPGWMLRGDSPMRFKLAADPDQWRWCMQFVLACTRAHSDATTRRLLALAFLSRDLLHGLLDDHPDLQFAHARSGKLVLHREAATLEAARRLLDYQRTLGCAQEVLSPEACVRLEPALEYVQDQLAGAIYTASEESGDCHLFCAELERLLRKQGVAFRFETRVSRLQLGTDGVVSAWTGTEKLAADHIVVASGAASTALLKPLGLNLPLYPLKGYSLTLPVADDAGAPHISVTDFQRKVVYARLNTRLRVAGMADLTGRTNEIDPGRVATLRAEAKAVFPDAGDYDAATAWAGLRPATPGGTPLIGGTPHRNLWINVGQGALGFTLAMSSGQLMADAIAGRKPALDFALAA